MMVSLGEWHTYAHSIGAWVLVDGKESDWRVYARQSGYSMRVYWAGKLRGMVDWEDFEQLGLLIGDYVND